MAELSTIARPYAEALFRTATEGDLNAWAGLVGEMAAVAGRPEMQALISDPKIDDKQLFDVFVSVIRSVLPDQAHAVRARNFISLVIENGRLALMPEIAQQFALLKNRREGSADAEIVSAFPMSDAQVAELVGGLQKKFGMTIKARVTVDQSLIGGVRVVVGDQVIDTSVRAQLDRMRSALAA
jgi:F-type H+-transporting ATPase subunit delta